MKGIDFLRRRILSLLRDPVGGLGRGARFIRYQLRLWPYCITRLRRNSLLTMSSALAFRTIFAMVPIIVLAILVVKAVGLEEFGQTFLSRALDFAGISRLGVARDRYGEEIVGPPGPQEVMMADRLQNIIDNVEAKLTLGRIGPIGAVIFIWTALTLMNTLESSLNRVFGAAHSRPFGRRMLLYWSVITLFPIVLAAAVWAGRLIAASIPELPFLTGFLAVVGWLQPVIIGILLLAAVYVLMPNTRVKVPTALVGATTALLLWLLAKWGFGLYVKNLVMARASLYGTLGLIPLFLFWMNISWVLFLFGAELAHTAGNLRALLAADRAKNLLRSSRDMLAVSLAIAIPFQKGEGPVSESDLSKRLVVPVQSLNVVLERLATMGVISRVTLEKEDGFVLARPATKIPVLQIMEIESCDASLAAVYPEEITRRIESFGARAKDSLGEMTLADLFRDTDS